MVKLAAKLIDPDEDFAQAAYGDSDDDDDDDDDDSVERHIGPAVQQLANESALYDTRYDDLTALIANLEQRIADEVVHQ